MSSAPANPRPQPPQQKRDILYDCGGCGEEVPLRPGDKIECPHCNYPVEAYPSHCGVSGTLKERCFMMYEHGIGYKFGLNV